MDFLNDLILVKRITEDLDGQSVLVVRRKTDASGKRFVLNRFTPSLQKLGPQRCRRAIEAFFESARTQEAVANESEYWAKILDVQSLDNGACLEADYYSKSAQWLINRKIKLRHRDLLNIALSIVMGLKELNALKGRPHGALNPKRVLLKGNGRVAGNKVVLNSPAPDSTLVDNSPVKDLYEFGRIFHWLISGKKFSRDRTKYPIQFAPGHLGKRKAFWQRLCNDLLNPLPSRRIKSLESLEARLRKARPPVRRILLLCMTLLVGLGAIGYVNRQPVLKWYATLPADWAKLKSHLPFQPPPRPQNESMLALNAILLKIDSQLPPIRQSTAAKQPWEAAIADRLAAAHVASLQQAVGSIIWSNGTPGLGSNFEQIVASEGQFQASAFALTTAAGEIQSRLDSYKFLDQKGWDSLRTNFDTIQAQPALKDGEIRKLMEPLLSRARDVLSIDRISDTSKLLAAAESDSNSLEKRLAIWVKLKSSEIDPSRRSKLSQSLSEAISHVRDMHIRERLSAELISHSEPVSESPREGSADWQPNPIVVEISCLGVVVLFVLFGRSIPWRSRNA